LPIGRFREFALDNLAMAKLNGETLVLEWKQNGPCIIWL
jgi:hypothetical protein